MNTDIQALFFDLGDTLVYTKKEIIEKICSLIRNITEINVDFDMYMKAFAMEWKKRNNPQGNALIKEVATEEAEKKYWENFLESLLLSLGISSPPKKLLGWLTKTYMDPESYACFDDVKPILQALSSNGYRLGLISNAFPSASKILDKHDLRKYFTWLILSYELSHIKPEPEIYKFALNKANVSPKDALFIDDRLDFVKGALDEGMLAMVIERHPSNRSLIETKSLIDRIKSLSDLQYYISLNYSTESQDDHFFLTTQKRIYI